MSRQWMRRGLGMASMASALLLVAAGPAAAQGQTAGLSEGIKRAWDGVKINVREAAEKMPEANYSFKPTPDVRSFGELVGHVAAALYGMCAGVKGEMPPVSRDTIGKQTTKADLVQSIQGAVTYCDGVYGATTDESALKPVKMGSNEAVPANLLWYNISHSNGHYGNMVTYMRLKGLVPPSTEPSQKPKPSAKQ